MVWQNFIYNTYKISSTKPIKDVPFSLYHWQNPKTIKRASRIDHQNGIKTRQLKVRNLIPTS